MHRKTLAAGLAAIFLAAPAAADDPAPFAEFTFKRVGVPKSGAGKRITVQIKPGEGLPPAPGARSGDADDAAPPADAPVRPKAADIYPWYWAAVSPRLEDGGSNRLFDAVNALDKAPAGTGVPSPRLADLQKIAVAHQSEILKATVGTRVSPALVVAVIGVESGGRPKAVSHAGAEGLMQLMPATATRFGVEDRTRPAENIRGGVAYLDWLLGEFGGDPVLALAGYNAGENAVKNNGGVPPYAETRAYVPKVLAAWRIARGLCMTPPELVSDGCVFATGQSG